MGRIRAWLPYSNTWKARKMSERRLFHFCTDSTLILTPSFAKPTCFREACTTRPSYLPTALIGLIHYQSVIMASRVAIPRADRTTLPKPITRDRGRLSMVRCDQCRQDKHKVLPSFSLHTPAGPPKLLTAHPKTSMLIISIVFTR